MAIDTYPIVNDEEERKKVIARIAGAAAIAFELIKSGQLEYLDSNCTQPSFDADAYWSVMDYGASQGLGSAGLNLIRKYSEDIAEQIKIEFEAGELFSS